MLLRWAAAVVRFSFTQAENKQSNNSASRKNSGKQILWATAGESTKKGKFALLKRSPQRATASRTVVPLRRNDVSKRH